MKLLFAALAALLLPAVTTLRPPPFRIVRPAIGMASSGSVLPPQYGRPGPSSVPIEIGATYKSAEFVMGAFLGIKLDITGRTTARLQLSGALTVTDTVVYSTDASGRIGFTLGDNMRSLLIAIDTKIVEAVYSPTGDYAYVVIKPPALPPMRIYLQRFRTQPRTRDSFSARVLRSGAETVTAVPEFGARALGLGVESLIRLGELGLRVQPAVAAFALPAGSTSPATATRVEQAVQTLYGQTAFAPVSAVAAPAPAVADRALAVAEGSPAVADRAGLPPIGSVFARSLTLPVIGMQTVRLTIQGETDARIELAGALSLDQRLSYGLNKKGGFAFELSDATQKLLQGMGVALTDADYDAKGDQASVTIKPPMVGEIKISLDREPQ
ncbi:hypothetical protein T492DRAFT_990908 [Pavlovales sp. CCMP2436]|nr:hypothetical protein T492DRAFT_990908 [Pavlovales sp. CCMP2436]